MKLTIKQKAFSEFYATNGNAAESAKLAGYSEKTAEQQGYQLLHKTSVKEYLVTLTSTDTKNRIMDAIERQTFLTDVIRGEINEGENTAKLSDRIRACELLGKMQGDFMDRQSIQLTSADYDREREEIIARILA